jgi:hypothetical protein
MNGIFSWMQDWDRHTERLKKYEMLANNRAKMNYYNCTDKEVDGFIPPEWDVYRKQHGYAHPAEERFRRFQMGMETWY